ncbi:MAG TPA: DUF3175 domain-containing protein [Polyangiaceae bacterium]|jgi:hypothetical protein|nr:DUF3175 domain-containing protein [Polyangiaceae bacterium]
MESKNAARTKSASPRRWSQHVTETSNALDLEEGVFRKRSPHAIAASLKRSAERSRRRKSDAFRSAMSMLTFYVNRAGKGLSDGRKRVLEQAKNELRSLYGREKAAVRRGPAPVRRRERGPGLTT